MRRILNLLARFRRDQRGDFMVIFSVMALVLIATSGAVVDFTSMEQARTRAQTALDAAALALQTKISTQTTTQLKASAKSVLDQQLNDASITTTINDATVDADAGLLRFTATVTKPTWFVALVGVPSVTFQLVSEVKRGSVNLEVAVALDLTLSMKGQKILDLRSATSTLIDLVVKDSQTPTYTKMALVPYSYGVNLNTPALYATNLPNKARGTPVAGIAISTAAWAADTAKNIGGITRAKPAVVTTTTTHGLVKGDYVYIASVKGMTDVNKKIYKVGNVNAGNKTFELQTTSGSNVDSQDYDKWTSKGTVTKCKNAQCDVVVTTSTAHGFANNDTVYITGVGTLTGLNDETWKATGVTTTTFVASGSGPTVGTGTGSGGSAFCTKYGCTYYDFTNASNDETLFQANTCATERATNAYTDDAPTTTALGFNYTSSGSTCLSATVIPLTTDKVKLHALASTLAASGTTAGHIGLAWAWYMVAPDFGYLWTNATNRPSAYKAKNTVKAVILMTDGAFNTAYCNGVVSSNSDPSATGSGSRINCDSIDTSENQAKALCTAIKADRTGPIILYTVGFDIGSTTNADEIAARKFLSDCATDGKHFFQADDGTDLQAAFKAIGQSLSELRLSR